MECKNCKTINDDDAIFCKKCGTSFETINEKRVKTTSPKEKIKTKKVVKTKVKKVKEPNKETKDKPEKVVKKGMNLFQKILMFLMFIIIVILSCIVGFCYYEYQKTLNIEVPNTVGLKYEDAINALTNSKLKVEKAEYETADTEKINVVIKQNKTVGSKVAENTTVKVYVGKIKKYKMEKFIGLNIDKATNKLEHLGIDYEVEEFESTTGKDDTVIKQYPNKNVVITYDSTIHLVVNKLIKEDKEETDDTNNEKDESDDLIEVQE